MPEPAPSILVVGSTMIDLVAYADCLPGDGETLVGTEFADGVRRQGREPGGRGRPARGAGRAGEHLGEDAYGASYLAELRGPGRRHDVGAPGAGLVGRGADLGRRRRDEPDHLVPGANDETSPELAVAAFDAVGPSVVVAQFEIAAGDDRGRRSRAPGPRA